MNEVDLLRKLGERARDEAVCEMDVAARVIQRIARQRPHKIDSPLAVFLLSACACALLVLAILATQPARAQSDTMDAFAEAAIDSTGPEAVAKVFRP